MAARGREPEVIIFEEKRTSRPFKRKIKIENEVELDRKRKVLNSRKIKLEIEGIDFKETMKEIRAFNSNSLEGEEKKQSEEEYIKMLGGTGPKPRKMPYPELLSRLKKQKEKKRKEKEMLSDVVVAQSTMKSKTIQGKKRLKGRQRNGLESNVGKFKEGTLKLSTRDIKNFKSAKR